MRRFATILLTVAVLGQSAAMAQQNTPIDVASIPDAVKTLNWKSIDLASLTPRERCQALMLFNHAISEIGAQTTSNADLMSEYIDTNDLGSDFMNQPPIDASKALTIEDGQKVAVALLRGPMASSTYANELADVPDNQLAAYQQLYQSGAQAKWSGFVHNRLQMLSMSNFLQTSGKLADYNAWVPGEMKRRSDEFEAELAKKNAAAQAQREVRQEKAQAEKQAKEQEEAQQQQAKATQQMQQAIASAGQSQAPSDQPGDYNDDYYYGGGAYLARGAWTRDAAYAGAAAARTDNRMANWSRSGAGRTGGAGRSGGGGRGRR